ncbi:MAG: TPR repeat protein [Porticoccus sp.]|jgi:TPR repeat protein
MNKCFLKSARFTCLLLLITAQSLADNLNKQPALEQLMQARIQWEAQSQKGDVEASAKLGALYLSGSLGSPDFIKARKYLALSAETDLSARLAYGHLLMNGLGGKADLAAAEQFFAKAAAQGSLEGQYLKAKLILGRNASETEVRSAVNGISSAANKGFPPALSTIAEFYRTGTFLEQSPEKAIEYFLKAVDGGYTEALSTVAEMYLFAELSSANIEKAEDFYRQAISQGVKSARYSFAFLLYNKEPNNKDLMSEAYRVARVAASAWDERCQYLLGLMYYEGKAVSRDNEQAHFWLDLAASAGVFEAHHIRALAAKALTKEQISKVKIRAREWFDENHGRPHVHQSISNSTHRYK